MPTSTNPTVSIELYAELAAKLDDGFAARAAVLAGAGFDEVSWKQLEEHWIAQLGSGDPKLVEQFSEVYARTRRSLSSSAVETAPKPEDARFLTSEAQPWRAEAVSVGWHVGGEVPALLPAPAGARIGAAPGVSSLAEPVARPAARGELAGTTDFCLADLAPALPFVDGPARLAVAPAPPRAPKRAERQDATLDAPIALVPAPLPFPPVGATTPTSAPRLDATLDFATQFALPATPFTAPPAVPTNQKPRTPEK